MNKSQKLVQLITFCINSYNFEIDYTYHDHVHFRKGNEPYGRTLTLDRQTGGLRLHYNVSGMDISHEYTFYKLNKEDLDKICELLDNSGKIFDSELFNEALDMLSSFETPINIAKMRVENGHKEQE